MAIYRDGFRSGFLLPEPGDLSDCTILTVYDLEGVAQYHAGLEGAYATDCCLDMTPEEVEASILAQFWIRGTIVQERERETTL